MKNSIVLAALGIFSLTACTKSALDNNGSGSGTANIIPASSVPASVMTTFNNNFRGATEVEWQHNSSSFNSQFNLGGQRHDAGFDDNGHQSSHSIICLDAPVPQLVLDAFRQRYPNDNVYEWNLRNDGSWKAHLMRGTIKYEATFSATGIFIKFEQA